MNSKKAIPFIVAALLIALAFTGCSKAAPAPAQSGAAMTAAPVSDGSEDLKIDYQFDTAKPDPNNYFTFSGNMRYMAVDKDQADETTGASKLGSTHLFHAYLYDVEGKTTMASGLRSFFLYAVNPYDQAIGDNVNVSKASDGVITIEYAHRGTAYRIQTDAKGDLMFPDGIFQSRAIGYIKGAGPQVISTDFSADGTAATIDWAKVWDKSVASGKEITAGVANKTGDIMDNGASPDSMYYFDGTLKVALDNGIITIKGSLTAVPRH